MACGRVEAGSDGHSVPALLWKNSKPDAESWVKAACTSWTAKKREVTLKGTFMGWCLRFPGFFLFAGNSLEELHWMPFQEGTDWMYTRDLLACSYRTFLSLYMALSFPSSYTGCSWRATSLIIRWHVNFSLHSINDWLLLANSLEFTTVWMARQWRQKISTFFVCSDTLFVFEGLGH